MDRIRPFHNLLLVLCAAAAGALTWYLMPEAMAPGARYMAGLFAVALVLWVSEAIPLFATSLLIIMCESWIIVVTAPEGEAGEYTLVLNAFASPIIWIFLGGFILAKAVQREGLDVQMAGLLMRPFGSRPPMVLAGFMVITALFSMFMSNTATTAMMIVLVQPFLRTLPEGARFRTALLLAIPFAANIGGIGTPIGTPPNAVAIGQLEQMRGIHIGFADWMLFAIPLLLGALGALWITLLLVYRPDATPLAMPPSPAFKLTRKALIVYATFTVTVALWLSGTWHGIPTAVVAVLPAAILTMTGVIGRTEFNHLDWDVLMLIAGGIALGTGVTATGLDNWIVGLLPAGNVPLLLLAALFCVLAVGLSTVMSNSVAANLLIPVAIAATMSLDNPTAGSLVVLIAITSSFAMSLPISTPPNAIAYSTNQLSSRDILFVGGLCSIVATTLIILTGPAVVGFFFRLVAGT